MFAAGTLRDGRRHDGCPVPLHAEYPAQRLVILDYLGQQPVAGGLGRGTDFDRLAKDVEFIQVLFGGLADECPAPGTCSTSPSLANRWIASWTGAKLTAMVWARERFTSCEPAANSQVITLVAKFAVRFFRQGFLHGGSTPDIAIMFDHVGT